MAQIPPSSAGHCLDKLLFLFMRHHPHPPKVPRWEFGTRSLHKGKDGCLFFRKRATNRQKYAPYSSENSRHFHFVLASFQKNLCAKSKNFWCEFGIRFGAIASSLSAQEIKGEGRSEQSETQWSDQTIRTDKRHCPAEAYLRRGSNVRSVRADGYDSGVVRSTLMPSGR